MTDRRALPKTLRFEVFKRDRFTCQYCGAKAPDVLLEIDHIEPIASGGSDELLNLITACKPCNLGKGARRLTDSSALEKQRAQLEDLEERREQLELLLQWQRSLVDFDGQVLTQVAEFWSAVVPSYSLNEHGRKTLQKLLTRFSASEITEAMRVAATQYLEIGPDKRPTQESVERAFEKVGGICTTKRREKTQPYMRDLYYVRGILRKRFSYVEDSVAIPLLESAFERGYDFEELKQIARQERSWTRWCDQMNELLR